jgi:ubiquinone/menaquinone biosynthesis C-methylase UbiE
VLAFAEKLPFKDKAFDFVIASHVLEHSDDPAKFLDEIQRVSKAGYIEVPDAFMERINPYPDHRLEITIRSGKLIIRKKNAWRADSELVELYEDRVKDIMTRHVMPEYPFDFHVRYYWDEKIEYEIINPNIKIFSAEVEQVNTRAINSQSFQAKLKSYILKIVRSFFSQHSRNSHIDLIKIMQCTNCFNSDLIKINHDLVCNGCGKAYPYINNWTIDMSTVL